MPWFLRMTLTLFPIILVVQIYVLLGIKSSLREIWSSHQKKWKILLGAILLYFNLFPLTVLILYLFGGIYSLYIFKPQTGILDLLISFPFWWGMISSIEILPYFLLIDILNGVNRLFKRKFDWSRGRAGLKLTLFLFFFCYVGIRLYLDTYKVNLTEHRVHLSNIAAEFDGLRLTLIGDIQVDRYTQEKKLSALREKVDASRSDLLFFSGDLVTSGQNFIDQGLETICSFSGNSGKFACMGDHDFWANPRRISQGMSDCGWIFLRNTHEVVTWKGKRIVITGITEIYSQKMSVKEMTEILSQAPASDLKIIVLHQPSPRLIALAAQHGYQIILAGHTHGGQIQFKPFGVTLTPSMMETPYYSGLFQVGETVVAVTNGIGLTLAPVRYHAGAEITQLILSVP